MKGVFNKIVSVDLSNKLHQEIEVKDEVYKNFLGGRGLGAKLFTDRVSPQIDALSPENKMVFTIGPVTGTSVSTSGRISIGGKSPLTHGIKESNGGGMAGD